MYSHTHTITTIAIKATPSWEFYAEAAEEEIPLYRVERAKSGRSRCKKFGTKLAKCNVGFEEACDGGGSGAIIKEGDYAFIGKGDLRIGSFDEMSGSYGRWNHLRCWRVPNRIWKGVPDREFELVAADCISVGDDDVLDQGRANNCCFCGRAEFPSRTSSSSFPPPSMRKSQRLRRCGAV